MSSIKYLSLSYKSEFLKTKNTFVRLFPLIGSFFIPLILFLYYFFSTSTLQQEASVNPWDSFFSRANTEISGLLIPIFVVMLVSIFFQIENKANGHKLIFSLPLPRWSIYLGKLAVICTILLITYIIYAMALLLVGVLLGMLKSEYHFLGHAPNIITLVKFITTHFLLMLGIVGIQFWFNFRMKNAVVPIAFGVALVILGLFMLRLDFSQYFPYSYGFLSNSELTTQAISFSLVYFAITSILGILNITRMNIKN